jgi:Flp pilus assembly protein CpaB
MADRGWLIAGVVMIVLAVAGSIVLVLGAAGAGGRSTAPVAAATNLSARVPEGTVATAIRLDPTASVGGAIQPGDVVDLLAYVPEQLSGGEPVTRVLVREGLVYAATKGTTPQTVTLAMPPSQALQVQQAIETGARPVAVVRTTKGAIPSGPEVFGDRDLISWLARLAATR